LRGTDLNAFPLPWGAFDIFELLKPQLTDITAHFPFQHVAT